jgi:3-oxoacyl-[acyl-carrier protein] reductase
MEEKTVLITGASGGIGSAASWAFAKAGYRVALHYFKSQEKCRKIYNEIVDAGTAALMVSADVSDQGQVEVMFEQINKALGGVDVLVNNAGIAQQKLFTDITEAEWDRMFAVNMKGTANCCRLAVPHMVSQKQGKIINVSSVWGICGASCEVHYSAAKAAVIGFTKALAKELGPSGIQVNCVAPGVIKTGMTGELDKDTIQALKDETPLGKIGQPRDIAECILYLASEKADFITGQVISPNGGFVI